MRDYRSLTAKEFVAEGIEMKLRWLARRLRWKDKTEQIEQWVKAIASLVYLLQQLKGDGNCSPPWTSDPQSTQPWKSNYFTISAPNMVDCKGSDFRAKPRTEGVVRSVSMEVEVVESILDQIDGRDKRQDGDVRICRATPVSAKLVKIDGDRKTINVEPKEMVQSADIAGDEVVASGTVGNSENKMEIEANENEELKETKESKTDYSAENEQLFGKFDINSEEIRDLLREGLNQRLQANGMVNKVDGKLSGFPDGTYTQACFWKIVKGLEKDLGLQKRFLVTKSEVRRQLQTEMYLGYGLRREG